ncbi:hypothetical protein BU26DRAFT_67978 [Trematosphaeria pertusa]|uniref:Uncharacterized protein n=1 Tax=Trematosphaeria pertusa TaxID=390896 RepID=A0A6A6I627_9PLEO|nr:uncharacterized protein BU26DRAFT_67978 [Trematosphaeria pertusa]KAF2245392.1 hypothetical protein BU26DRAFT_67978 [Trematosphaeria pertusa]
MSPWCGIAFQSKRNSPFKDTTRCSDYERGEYYEAYPSPTPNPRGLLYRRSHMNFPQHLDWNSWLLSQEADVRMWRNFEQSAESGPIMFCSCSYSMVTCLNYPHQLKPFTSSQRRLSERFVLHTASKTCLSRNTLYFSSTYPRPPYIDPLHLAIDFLRHPEQAVLTRTFLAPIVNRKSLSSPAEGLWPMISRCQLQSLAVPAISLEVPPIHQSYGSHFGTRETYYGRFRASDSTGKGLQA